MFYNFIGINSYTLPLDWTILENRFPFLHNLKGSEQSHIYHQEGDVYVHTQMVVEELVKSDEFKSLSSEEKEISFLTALFHDIAKPATQEIHENGDIKNPGHSRLGALMCREILYKMEYDPVKREDICSLIEVHQDPFWAILHSEKLEYKTISISLTTRNIKLLCIQARADMRGRICPKKEQEDALLNIDLFEEYAREIDCWNKPYSFPNEHTKRQYLIDPFNKIPSNCLFDTTEFQVTIMCGLPGSGKSSYAKVLNIPIISMDIIRKELGIEHKDNQGIVRQTFLAQVKEHLAKKISFVIDNVNMDKQRRAQIIDLCASYKAKIRLIYKELPYSTCRKRNLERDDYVPEEAWEKHVKKMSPPTLDEAHFISYII